MDKDDELAKNQRFLRETEQVIRIANKEIIHKHVPPISSERIVSFAVSVAKLRAEYVEAAFKFADVKDAGGEESVYISDLRECRTNFEEARDAFIALQRAIELGYMAVE